MKRPAGRTERGAHGAARPPGPGLPAELEISLSNRCPFACSYCYFGIAPGGRPQRLTAARACLGIDRYIEAAAAAGVKIERIGFPDSPDPLQRYETLKACVDHIRARLGGGLLVEVQTNGLLLDAGKAGYFFDRGVRVVLRLDGARETNDLHRVFRGGRGGSAYDAVMRRLKALPAGYLGRLQAAPSFTPATAGALGRSVEALYELGFRDIQLKSLNLPSIWPDEGLKNLRAGLRELKRFCLPLIAQRARRGKGLRLHLSSLKKEESAGFCEFVLGCDGKFYPGGYTPKAPAGLALCAGDVKNGVDVPRLAAAGKGILGRLRRRDAGGCLDRIPGPATLYLAAFLGGLDTAELIRSNGAKAGLILEELGSLLRLDEALAERWRR